MARPAYKTRYYNTGVKKLTIELYKNTNKDIIAFLETVDNKQGLIKQLLHDEMKRQNFVYVDNEKDEP